jgi:hypothetical protein
MAEVVDITRRLAYGSASKQAKANAQAKLHYG